MRARFGPLRAGGEASALVGQVVIEAIERNWSMAAACDAEAWDMGEPRNPIAVSRIRFVEHDELRRIDASDRPGATFGLAATARPAACSSPPSVLRLPIQARGWSRHPAELAGYDTLMTRLQAGLCR